MEDLIAAFARRREEWDAAVKAGREFLGYEDDPLPERVAFWRARLASERIELASSPEITALEPCKPLDGEEMEESGAVPAESGADGIYTLPIVVPLLASEGAPVSNHAQEDDRASAPTWDQLRAMAEQTKAERRKRTRQKALVKGTETTALEREPVQISLFDLF